MNPATDQTKLRRPRKSFLAFTLLELLVSLTVLSLLMVLVFSMIDRTQAGWTAAEARVSQFREARNAFEQVTRRVSQAVLNSYWDYDRPNPTNTVNPGKVTAYGRHSELHFVCGPIEGFGAAGAGALSTHGIFFQAPLGYSADKGIRERSLESLLNVCGYYVEYGGDAEFKPSFVLDVAPNRERFRLMEFRPPTEEMTVYFDLKDIYKSTNSSPNALYKWFAKSIGGTGSGAPPARPIGENIIALVFRPKKSELESGIPTDIAPNYLYDTRMWQHKAGSQEAKRSRNLLPPLIEITMVAVSERSMVQYQQINGEASADWAKGLFTSSSTDISYEKDLKTLQERLELDRIDYRVFNETVGIRASKWGEEPEN